MRVVVIGGGFIGQLVQLAYPLARVLDWKKYAPKDHLETRVGPQYLWEPIPNVLSFSFEVTTLVDGDPPTPEKILAYKRKVKKEDDNGDWEIQFQHKTLGWHSALPVPRIEYNAVVERVNLLDRKLIMKDDLDIPYDVLVSTIPLPVLMKMTGLSHPSPFESAPIFMRTEERDGDARDGMVLNYLSTPHIPYYRVTRYGKTVYYEALTNQLGCRKVVPGKIYTHEGADRIVQDLASQGVFCYGRFAAWCPDELAHQTWQKIEAAPWRT